MLMDRFFAALCARSDGDDRDIVDALDIGAALHLSGAEVLEVADGLIARGLIEDATRDGNRPFGEVFVHLTAWGAAECEQRRAARTNTADRNSPLLRVRDAMSRRTLLGRTTRISGIVLHFP